MAGWWGISKKFSFVVSVQSGLVVQTWWNYPTSVSCFPLELSLDFCLGGCSPHNPSYLAFRFSRIVIITERIVLPLIVIVMTSSVWTDKQQLQLKHNRVGRVRPFLEACSGDQRSNKRCLWVRKEAGEGDTAWSSLYSGGELLFPRTGSTLAFWEILPQAFICVVAGGQERRLGCL